MAGRTHAETQQSRRRPVWTAAANFQVRKRRLCGVRVPKAPTIGAAIHASSLAGGIGFGPVPRPFPDKPRFGRPDGIERRAGRLDQMALRRSEARMRIDGTIGPSAVGRGMCCNDIIKGFVHVFKVRKSISSINNSAILKYTKIHVAGPSYLTGAAAWAAPAVVRLPPARVRLSSCGTGPEAMQCPAWPSPHSGRRPSSSIR